MPPVVALAPDGHPQFLNSAGDPLAGGFLFTYIAGTNTLSPTYLDSGGTIFNPDPIPLDSSGAPTNGDVQVQIWLINQAYKFVAYDANMVFQWSADDITSYLGLLNDPNIWTFPQTFTLPIAELATFNQFLVGAPPNVTTLDYQPPVGPITLHFPNTGDTMVGRNTTDTLTNKTLQSPVIISPTFSGNVPLVQLIYKNPAPVTHTGTITTDTIFTTTIPANQLGPNGKLRITLVFSQLVYNSGAAIAIKLNGATIGSISNTFLTPLGVNNIAKAEVFGGNSAATNVQAWDGLVIGNAIATKQIAIYGATAVDTTLLSTLTLTSQSLNTADSQQFEMFLVELF